MCPDDPDCEVKAAEFYAREAVRARRQFLKDYGCPEDKIRHADGVLDDRERGSIGME